MLSNHWSTATLFLYILIAWTGFFCLKQAKRNNDNVKFVSCSTTGKITVDKYLLIWYLVWLTFALMRYISPEIGGTDAPTYIEYFEKCLEPVSNLYSYRTEVVFRIFTKFIRSFCSDYHLYFFIIYSVIVLGFILFLKEYSSEVICFIPIIAGAYQYFLTYNVVRNGFSIGILMIAFYFLKRKKYVASMAGALLSILMHTASVFYAPFILFYLLIKKWKDISYRKLLALGTAGMVVVDLLCQILRKMVLSGQLKTLFSKLGLGQPFDVYANAVTGDGFWKEFLTFRISRLQLLLVLFLFIFIKQIDKDVKKQGTEATERFGILKIMVLYDYLMLPLVYWFSVWRGPEYFLLARLIVWGEIIHWISTRLTPFGRKCLYLAVFVIFTAFFSLRIYKYWDMSNLTPYYLEPIGHIIEFFTY